MLVILSSGYLLGDEVVVVNDLWGERDGFN